MMDSSKFLTEREVVRLRSSIEREDLRNRLLFTFLLTYGMRVNECLSITKGDIDFNDSSVKVRGSKQGRDRQFPLSDDLKKLVRRHTKDMAADEKLFKISYRMVEWIWRRLRPNREKVLHSMRHTVAISVYKKTRDIRLVQNVLGHKNINNTMIYLDFVHSQEEFKKALF